MHTLLEYQLLLLLLLLHTLQECVISRKYSVCKLQYNRWTPKSYLNPVQLLSLFLYSIACSFCFVWFVFFLHLFGNRAVEISGCLPQTMARQDKGRKQHNAMGIKLRTEGSVQVMVLYRVCEVTWLCIVCVAILDSITVHLNSLCCIHLCDTIGKKKLNEPRMH